MIRFAPQALTDIERIFEFNLHRDPATAHLHIDRIRSAVMVLDEHPKIGRRYSLANPLRELVISYGRTGYVALYVHREIDELITIVAIKHQREAGYRDRSR